MEARLESKIRRADAFLHAPLRLLVYSEGHLASGQLDQLRGDRVAARESVDRLGTS